MIVMNRTVLTMGAIILIVLLGLGIYWNVSKREANPQPTAEEQGGEQVAVQSQTLEEFIQQSNNQQCNFVDMESETTGTIYVSNGQLRGDFTTNSDGIQVTDEVSAHVIANSQDVYFWMDGVEEGYKTSFESVSEVSEDLPLSDIVNPESSAEYECSPWTADSSMFELPDIEFNDLTELIENVGGEGNALQCAACDSLSGEAQTQCKAALSCN